MTSQKEEQPIQQSSQPTPERLEDVLLERLRNEPDIKPQIPAAMLALILLSVVLAGVVVFFIFKKPDTFAVTEKAPQAEEPHVTQIDSTALFQKRLRYAGFIDSLEHLHSADLADPQATVALANAYYDVEYWDKAMPLYDVYLKKNPKDVDARVDYAYSIAQQSGDFKKAVAEVEKALVFEPNHVNALFNAGILSLRANLDDKTVAIKISRKYFLRAQKAAEGVDPRMSQQISKVLAEIDRIEKGDEIPK